MRCMQLRCAALLGGGGPRRAIAMMLCPRSALLLLWCAAGASLVGIVSAAAASASSELPIASMATFWAGDAHFEFVSKARFLGPDGQFGMNVGFDFVVGADGTWHVFHREYGFDALGERPPACKRDRARIVVRNSSDEGATWSAATVILSPGSGSGPAGCALVDGAAFWDAPTRTWHYLSQCLAPPDACKGCGGWQLCHYSTLPGEANPAAARWRPSFNPSAGGAPSVAGGQLWSAICAGKGKHCSVKGGADNVGTVDEGTPQIVKKDADGYFWVTFHGWDPHTLRSARGVARTKDFAEWQTSGDGLPADAIMSRVDCEKWTSDNFTWGSGGCVGGGEGSILLDESDDFMYQLIEAPDKSLGCLGPGQNWVLGLSRAKTFLPAGQWEPFHASPTVVPHVKQGCYIQYHRLFRDGRSGATYLEFWADNWMQIHRLVPGAGRLPIVAGAPPPTLANCTTKASCLATCDGIATCPADGTVYCCADTRHCGGRHACPGTAGLLGCACDAGSGPSH